MRVKGGPRSKNRRKKVLEQTKGFTGRARNANKVAREALDRSLAFATRDRRVKTRNFRSLWITRITAACRARGFSYSRFIGALKKNEISINRKMLADLAATDPRAFDQVVSLVELDLGLSKAS